MDPIRRKILIDGRRGDGDGRGATRVRSAGWTSWARRSGHVLLRKTAPFASTMRRPVPASRCCSSLAEE